MIGADHSMPPDPQSPPRAGRSNRSGQAAGSEIDRAAVRRGFARAASRYDLAPVLQREVAGRMAQRLTYVARPPSSILDLGCGTGADLAPLGERYPQATLTGCDVSLPMLERAGRHRPWFRRLFETAQRLVCTDALALPFADRSFDLVWSNLALQWTEDLAGALTEALRALEIGGLLTFSVPGPDTLMELREAFGEADGSPHVHRFPDMHDLGDLLVSCGFADPVMEMERIVLTYADANQLFRELRQAGAANAASGRRRALTGKAAWRRMLDRYERLRSGGRLPATFEIVYGHAWKPQPRTVADGRAIVRFPSRAQRSPAA